MNDNIDVKKGTLFVVSTPIGNRSDISQRAVKVLKEADLVVCEEMKVGAQTLKSVNLKKDIDTLNVKNEDEKSIEYLKLLESGSDIALISDAGTPLFADPGLALVRNAVKKDINVVVVPGASSIMTALVRSTFSIEQFLFAGFLDRDPNKRIKELERLSRERRTVCILETPYRLKPFLANASSVMPDRQCYIGFNLTTPYETHHYGTFRELNDKFKDEKVKAEFVIVFEGESGQIISKNTKYKNYPKNKGR
jgi:16S rRNA (cytidine1402-2'-O)-methyltransferase